MERFNNTAVLEMRNSGGAGGLQFNAESFLMMDSNHHSPSESLDLDSFNPSSLTADFAAFLDSTVQNSMDIGGPNGSSGDIGCHDMAVDEWSGGSSINSNNNNNNNNNNTNNVAQSRQGQQSSSSPSQCQSSVSQGQGAASNADNNNNTHKSNNNRPSQSYGFDKGVWDGSHVQKQRENNTTPHNSAPHVKVEVKKENFPSGQGAMGFQNQNQQGDGHMRAGPNGSDLSPQESASHETKPMPSASQSMEFDPNQVTSSGGFNEDVKPNILRNPQQQQGMQMGQVYPKIEGDGQLTPRLPNGQTPNMLFQRSASFGGSSRIQQQGNLQQMQGGIQLHGMESQNSLQSQLQEQYGSLSSPAAVSSHPFSTIAQNHGVGQSQAQMPNMSNGLGQNQNFFHARQMLSGTQSSPFHNNQQIPFHLGRSSSNSIPQHGGNLGPHFPGLQHLNQLQPRPQNPMFQNLRFGGRNLLQGTPATSISYGNNGAEIGVRARMTPAVAMRCVEIIKLCVQEQRKRPQDNNITFWRKVINDFFAPGATERWCYASYNSSQMSRNAQGLFPMEFWFCNLCGKQSGRGFEYGTDVLPRLMKIKYDSGLLDELLFLDMPEESYIVTPGKWVVEFQNAVHESIFQELRVVRNGKLRVSFNNTLKILSWEFCCESHSEAVPRRNLLQQAQQLSNLVKEAEKEGFDKDSTNLKSHCDAFTACFKQLKGKLEAPNVNDLGLSKRYVRCLQIAEVVNCMKDLVSFERKTGLGPIESLNKFPTIKKLQSNGMLHQPSGAQVANSTNQVQENPNSPYAKMAASRLSLPSRQSLAFSQTPSSVLQGCDPMMAKVHSSMNQMQGQLKGQFDPRSQNIMQTQGNGQMQAPSIPHLEASAQGHAQNNNQYVSQLTQGYSPMHGQHLNQLQSPVSGQAPSQILNGQAQNMNHVNQQIYDHGGNKQINFQPSNQMVTQSRSLNRTGQQSLPGTPQSELSDMRSNP